MVTSECNSTCSLIRTREDALSPLGRDAGPPRSAAARLHRLAAGWAAGACDDSQLLCALSTIP
jgi:hypothetical protein